LLNFSFLSATGIFIFNLHKAEIFNPSLHHEVHKDKILDFNECLKLSNKVKEMKNKWQERNVSMKTLGSASYLDLNHEQLSSESNKLLEPFSDLHETVRQYLENHLGNKVVYRKKCCKPGFHIFECNTIFSYPVASIHKDMQFNRLTYYEDEDIDTENLLSFTLPIELPRKAGLYLFETEISTASIYFSPRTLWFNLCKKIYVPYNIGEIVLHKGMQFHMIGPSEKNNEKYRLTLQGHGVFDKNKKVWNLYW